MIVPWLAIAKSSAGEEDATACRGSTAAVLLLCVQLMTWHCQHQHQSPLNPNTFP